MNDLNITIEIIASYKAWIKTIDDSERSNSVYYEAGLARKGNSKTRAAEKAAKNKFIKLVIDAGNDGDWDVEKIIANLSSQPKGITYI